MPRKIDFICEHCGPEEGSIYWDATTYWNAGSQEYESDGEPMGDSFCGNCGGESCAQAVDVETREILALNPDNYREWIPVAEAEAIRAANRAKYEANRRAVRIQQEAERLALANAEAMAQGYEIEVPA